MKYSTIGYILGQVLKFEGIFMLLPFLTGMIYHENEAYSYLIIGIICPRMPDHVKKSKASADI